MPFFIVEISAVMVYNKLLNFAGVMGWDDGVSPAGWNMWRFTMWLLFGAIAIVTAIINIVWAAHGKDSQWFRFASLSFTSLTLCSFYSQSARWAAHEDWAALMDVVPTMSRWLWVCAIASILINSVPLFGQSSR